MDLRGIPTPICPECESPFIRITAIFDPETYEIQMYLLDDAECLACGSKLTAPTPLDVV